MKKMISLLLTAVLGLSLAGCSGTAQGTGGSGSSQEDAAGVSGTAAAAVSEKAEASSAENRTGGGNNAAVPNLITILSGDTAYTAGQLGSLPVGRSLRTRGIEEQTPYYYFSSEGFKTGSCYQYTSKRTGDYYQYFAKGLYCDSDWLSKYDGAWTMVLRNDKSYCISLADVKSGTHVRSILMEQTLRGGNIPPEKAISILEGYGIKTEKAVVYKDVPARAKENDIAYYITSFGPGYSGCAAKVYNGTEAAPEVSVVSINLTEKYARSDTGKEWVFSDYVDFMKKGGSWMTGETDYTVISVIGQ